MALEIVRNDDFIEYFLYPNIDQASESEEEDVLIEFLKKINEISSNYTSSYIWHKDPFVLKARNRNSHLLNPESKGESRETRVMRMFINPCTSPYRATSRSSTRHHVLWRQHSGRVVSRIAAVSLVTRGCGPDCSCLRLRR